VDLSGRPRPRIERLPDELVVKIAAGEVVERPASVVKELVENALDAGAFNVAVEIEDGGKSLIRVRDDGCGMGREDARLAIERHATSKLRSLEDLAELGTHGFRGEALPSIAGVGHLLLRTRDESDAAGSEVEVRPGREPQVRDTGHPRGTTVEVRDLFGAVPARRKFLRADATEAANVAETVSLLALARPGTGFQLSSGGRTLLRAPTAEGLDVRVYQLFGRPFLDELLRVDLSLGPVRVSGLVARPEAARRSRAALRLFVNGRVVRDRGLAKAVIQAYRATGAADARPEAILFVELPAHLVDVNVHPAKTEVRFADPRAVWTAVERAVGQALSEGVRREAPLADASRVREAAERYRARGSEAPQPGQERLAWPATAESSPGEPRREPAAEGDGLGLPEAATPLGQHRNTYILASDGENLLLVDQHTAHERVRFESLVARLASRSVESQGLLAPIVLSLPPALLPVAEARSDDLRELGFDIDDFGGGTVRVRAVPALLGAGDAGEALTRLLRDFLEREDADWAVSGPRDRLAATLACHSAVRAGQPLAAESMGAILRDLARARHASLCPHGRPTLVRIPRDEVARWFGRTGWRRR
jgi:DNA mismatch repair protein MutL